ncbi:MAG: sulfate permease [Pseudomonadales bacterium]|nr:sulfate permease [Pseudomonadales bacterium]
MIPYQTTVKKSSTIGSNNTHHSAESAIRLRIDLNVPNWRSYIPILDVLRFYKKQDFSHDLTAGLVLGVITIPQAIAYAFLAGLPPQAGLYACLVPTLLYAIFGSSRQLVVGPVAIAALMVAATVSEHARPLSDDYMGITAVLCLQAGIFLWLLRLTKMGGVVNLLSHPVISGFVNAAALLIIISQLKSFTGLPQTQTENPFMDLTYIYQHYDQWNSVALALGFASLLLLWGFSQYSQHFMRLLKPSISQRHPLTNLGPLIVAALGTLTIIAFNLDTEWNIATVGVVPDGLPSITMPPPDLMLWVALAPSAAMIALVSYVESYSIGTTLATREKTRLNSHQELIALGAANIGAAFTGAYPVAGSFSRSSVNYSAGGKTPLSSIVCSIVIVIALLWLTPLFIFLPHAVLAAIIIISVMGLVDFSGLRKQMHFYPNDAYVHAVTFIGVVFFSVESGLLLGVLMSIAFFVRRSSRPHIALVGRIGSSQDFRSTKRHEVETFAPISAVRIDENLYFANSTQVENRLYKMISNKPDTRHLLMVFSSISFIDTTGLEMLIRVVQSLKRQNITLHLSEVKGPVMDQLQRSEFFNILTGKLYFSTDQAMRELQREIDPYKARQEEIDLG